MTMSPGAERATKALREVATDLTALMLSLPEDSPLRPKVAALVGKTDDGRYTLTREVELLHGEMQRLRKFLPPPCSCGMPFEGSAQPHSITCAASGVPQGDDDTDLG